MFRKRAYVYLVAYESGFNRGDIEITSKEKLDSFDKLKTTRKIIAEKMGKNIDDTVVVITNIILLRREYNDEW